MDWFELHQRIDYLSEHPTLEAFSTDFLFGEARGKMFGALVGLDIHGQKKTLYAFSGQFNGYWSIPGWAPPLFDEPLWRAINTPREQKIKDLGNEIEVCHDPEMRATLRQLRKKCSQSLMKELHGLYHISNFRGDTQALSSFFNKQKVPTGTGDCCAPKLLASAQALKIQPLSIAEFYWGKSNRSQSKQHKDFYPPCLEKCHPILGFMLCGSQDVPPINFSEIKEKRN